MSFEHFREAQANRSSGYETALAEIRSGGKRTHWIWYIFPQIEGLGRSSMARAYALRDLAQACAYLREPVLRARYEEISAAVSEQLARGNSLEHIMGSRIDAQKLVSSLTLFRAAAETLAAEDPVFAALADRCAALLQQTAGQGYQACSHTIAKLSARSG
jgi:uncharacterized protein (DUF1810 family)